MATFCGLFRCRRCSYEEEFYGEFHAVVTSSHFCPECRTLMVFVRQVFTRSYRSLARHW